MAVASIIDLSTTLINGPEGGKPAYISMAGYDWMTGEMVIPEKALQYWPETLSDSIEVGWNALEVPGLSHSIMQWSFNGGRSFQMEVFIGRYFNHADDRGFLELGPDDQSADALHLNARIPNALRWLRSFCYPNYENVEVIKPPCMCALHVPGMELNEDGRDVVWTVMTGCDITYQKVFPSGKPRLAQVSLTFKQVIQGMKGNPLNQKGIETLAARARGFSDVGFGHDLNNISTGLP